MSKKRECCVCHELIQKSKRLVYQEFDNVEPYGFYRDMYIYDICDNCFKVFMSWIMRHRNENYLELGLEFGLKKEGE